MEMSALDNQPDIALAEIAPVLDPQWTPSRLPARRRRLRMRRELTDPWLRGVKPPAGGRLEIWDLRVSGLVLRITPAEGLAFLISAMTGVS